MEMPRAAQRSESFRRAIAKESTPHPKRTFCRPPEMRRSPSTGWGTRKRTQGRPGPRARSIFQRGGETAWLGVHALVAHKETHLEHRKNHCNGEQHDGDGGGPAHLQI